MILAAEEIHDVATPTGLMRCYLLRPDGPGRFPGVVFYSEIFQVTAPVRRLAAYLAGHGYLVAIPEVFHELEPRPGVVLDYDQAGSDRGNAHKYAKPVASYDADTRAALDLLAAQSSCSGALGAMGICLGGHLAWRAAFEPDVLATACFYATDIHTATLGAGQHDDTIGRFGEIGGELLAVWGRQDPHVPREGRERIHAALEDAGVAFSWHEVNGQHAFARDEGARYDAELTRQVTGLALDLFHRRLR